MEDLCADVICTQQDCDSLTGNCVPETCAMDNDCNQSPDEQVCVDSECVIVPGFCDGTFITCPGDLICDTENSTCVVDLCNNVNCPGGYCEDGTCYPNICTDDNECPQSPD